MRRAGEDTKPQMFAAYSDAFWQVSRLRLKPGTSFLVQLCAGRELDILPTGPLLALLRLSSAPPAWMAELGGIFTGNTFSAPVPGITLETERYPNQDCGDLSRLCLSPA